MPGVSCFFTCPSFLNSIKAVKSSANPATGLREVFEAPIVFARRLCLSHQWSDLRINMPWVFAIVARPAELLGFSLPGKDCGSFLPSHLNTQQLPLVSSRAYLLPLTFSQKIFYEKNTLCLFTCQRKVRRNTAKNKDQEKILMCSQVFKVLCSRCIDVRGFSKVCNAQKGACTAACSVICSRTNWFVPDMCGVQG